MTLTNQQIERYSRQIIVSEIGGIAQERLLASRLVLSGEPEDVQLVLYYLVGAGVGRIALQVVGDASIGESMIAHAQALNPEVAVEPFGSGLNSPTLMMHLVGSGESLAMAHDSFGGLFPDATLIARLDTPARIAIRGDTAPQAPCEMLREPFVERVANANFVAMVAAMEALKLLADMSLHPTMTIAFEGYSTRILIPSSGDQASSCR